MTSEKQSQGIGLSIAGVGAYVPDAVVTNDDLTQLVETSDEWISSRTGIRRRHVVSRDQRVVDLAVAAAKDALASAGMSGDEIQLVIVASSTSETVYPAVAAQVQHAIGATGAAGFDISLACTGFIASTIVASQFLKTGMYQTALVLGADIHSRQVDWSDRNTCVLFGDGAGAWILKAERGQEDNFLASELHLDGTKGPELTLFHNADNCPLVEPRTEELNPYVYMNGREMFKFAVGTVPKSILLTLEKAGLSARDLDYLVLHQANIRILQAMCEKLDIPDEKMIWNLDEYGNTSAASIPIALNEAVLTGRVKPGDLLGFCGFGAGAAWATVIARWTAVEHRPMLEAAVKKNTKLPVTIR